MDKNMEKEHSQNKELLKETFSEICNIVYNIDDRAFLQEFLECLFTPAERDDFANRWLLVKEIKKGTTQREIAKNFGMSLCKITRGSKELSKENSAFRKVLDNPDYLK
ncbi:MAG: trp operon repressor [Treponema sp.]|nr:trp operon repressor [Treponema sp.]